MHYSHRKPARVFLNPRCNRNTGVSRWNKISPDIVDQIGECVVENIISTEGMAEQVLMSYNKGERRFVAAGGDGTVHLLINAVLAAGLDIEEITFGAVGLGSSNDFHKPFRRESMIRGAPVRLNFENAAKCDLMQIDYIDEGGQKATRFCILNASIGITAEANAYFNLRSRLLNTLQRLSVEAAIVAAALRSIFLFQNLPCIIRFDGGPKKDFMITNLGIIKNPHFSGALCYDTSIEPDDGKLGVYLCYDQCIRERISCLTAIYLRRFLKSEKTTCLEARHVLIRSKHVFALEMDGEVLETSQAEFTVLPKKVRFCR